MSFGGSVSAMITSLKNNARPKRSFQGRFNHEHGAFKTAITSKDISQAELKQIKSDFRKRIKTEQRQQVFKISIICSLITIFLVAGIIIASKTYKISISAANQATKEKELKKESDRNLVILEFISKGNSAISRQDYTNAKFFINKAYVTDNNSKIALLNNAKVYILDCLENDSECELCKYYVDLSVERFGLKEVSRNLPDLMNEYQSRLAKEAAIRDEKIITLLNKGYEALDKKDLVKARQLIYEAYHIDEENYNANIGVLTLYIQKYLVDGDETYRLTSKLRIMEREYGETIELLRLRALYESKN